MSNTFTLSGTIIDSRTGAPISGAEVVLAKVLQSHVEEGAPITTGASGTWEFAADSGVDYVVRMPKKKIPISGPNAPVTSDVWLYNGQSFPALSADHTGVVLKADLLPGIQRTPEKDARYIASLLLAVQEGFADQTKHVQSSEEVAAALVEVYATLTEFLAPLGYPTPNLPGSNQSEPMHVNANVPCSSCQTKCYGSTDPNCMYNCIYVPVHCY